MARIPNCGKLTTFREILDEIMWDWDHPYTLKKSVFGDQPYFYINKLAIEPKYLIYKCDVYELEDGLFEKVEALYNLLQED